MSRHYGRFERTSMDAQTLLVVDPVHWQTYAYQAYNVSDVATEEGPWSWFDQTYAPWDVEPDVKSNADCGLTA